MWCVYFYTRTYTLYTLTPATHLIFAAAGEPPVPAAHPIHEGTCRTCGQRGSGAAFSSWVRPTFTDHDILRPGEIVCQACLFCFDEQSTLLQQMTGRDKPQRMRTYSHFVTDAGEWIVLTKADKPRMRELLLSEGTRLAAIAESGQKHVLLRTRPGFWQIELSTIEPDRDRLIALLALTDEAYTLGATKEAIQTGRYDAGSLSRMGPAAYRRLERALAPFRGSALFDLACFLTQKQGDVMAMSHRQSPEDHDGTAPSAGRGREPEPATAGRRDVAHGQYSLFG